jgi:hypothetical protein
MNTPHTPESPGEDDTIRAIREVINTMGVSREERRAGSAEFNAWGQQAAGDAEEYLVEVDAVQRTSPQQRAILACLGCQLIRGTSGVQGAYAQRIEKCTGEGVGTVLETLRALSFTRVLAAREERNRAEPGAPRILYAPTQSRAGRGLLQRLQPPEPCGLEQQPYRLNDEAEDYLLENGIGTRRDHSRREMLGCIACQLRTTGSVEAQRIADCQGTPSASAPTRLLRTLEEKGIMRSQTSTTSQGRGRPPRQFGPQDNALAAGFVQRLEVPESCGLDQPRSEEPETE